MEHCDPDFVQDLLRKLTFMDLGNIQANLLAYVLMNFLASPWFSKKFHFRRRNQSKTLRRTE